MNDFCIPNISYEERRKRLKSGVIMAAVTLAILIVLVALDISRWWRLALAPLFFIAASGYFQWRDKT